MHTLRSRLAAVALIAMVGQLAPAGSLCIALAHHHEAGVLECTCVGDTHDPMCPMHSSPNAMHGDAACHLGTASMALPPVFGMTALLERPFEPEPRRVADLAPAPAPHLSGRALPVDAPPPRA